MIWSKWTRIDREIFRLAWPNIISNVSVPLLSSVDTALMGSLSPLHLGAVGLGSMIFNFFYWNFGFLRMGTTGMTAQAFGKEDDQAITLHLFRALLVAFSISAVLLIFQHYIADLGIWVMQSESKMYELIYVYVTTRIWAAPATLGLYVLFGWLFGMQNARIPMFITIGLNLINIVLSYTFIVEWGWGIQGVALGTVLAQYAGFLSTLIWIFWKYRQQLTWPGLESVIELQAFGNFFKINRDIFLRTICLTFVFGFFYSQSSAFGPELLGVNVVMLQFLNWMSYGVDGFAYAAESVVGRWFGAGEEESTHAAIEKSFLWGGVCALIYSLIYAIWGEPLFLLFTDDQGLLELSRTYMWWMIILPLLGFASYIWDGVFVGLTAAKSMRNTMVFSLLIFLAIYYSTVNFLQFHALWFALSVFLVTRAASQHFLFSKWQLKIT